ncbi:hypothetical protein [Natrinema ejinorense]|uniref:Uncharacterized protein n=1 Tax=Natrinema ejinorense TaxID=373386 RepID=A0A2A5QR72_9EURY|nr:hypothetical protein [Natrinema ejinorense]PCR89341.1 hypothetical protein CP557_01580 [Natrinema ejinorense]
MYADDNHTEDDNGSNSTNTTLPGVVRGSLERLEDGGVDEAVALVRRLETAKQFDDAEANADTPELLEGGPMAGAHRYCIEGESDDAWLASNYTVPIGFDGGDV